MKFPLLWILVTQLFATQAVAFDREIHAQITAKVLAKLKFSPAAIEAIIRHAQNVDDQETNTTAAHFLNENFEEGSARLRTRLRRSAEFVKNCDRDFAWQAMGQAFHAIQDFYAHSNWVENHDKDFELAPLLNLTDPSVTVVCDGAQYYKGELTSGYWPDQATPSFKCSHFSLNKDKLTVPVNDWHRARVLGAVRLASESTALFVNQVENEFSELSANEKGKYWDYFRGVESRCNRAKKFPAPSAAQKP